MNTSTKAALLSCCVFPGLGHLYLKRFFLGALLALGAAAASYLIVSNTVRAAYEVVEKIEAGAVSPDVEAIAGLVSQQSEAGGESTNTAVFALTALWLIGIFDSYRVGRALEDAAEAAGERKA